MIADSMLAEVVPALCVIGVALLGFSMLTGRFPIRRGISVVIGCFLLLGAPSLATSLVAMINQSETASVASLPPPPPMPDARKDLPPATEDPYAGA